MHHPQSSLPDTNAVLRDLNRAKVAFQMRALATAIGCSSIIRDVDGDGLMLTVEPLQFVQPVGSPAGGAGHSHNPARCGSDFLLHSGDE